MVAAWTAAGPEAPNRLLGRIGAVLVFASCVVSSPVLGQGTHPFGEAARPQLAVVAWAPADVRGAELDLRRPIDSLRPRVHGFLPSRLWHALVPAFQVALRTMMRAPSCSDLFTARGTDGLELLEGVSFEVAASDVDRALCERGEAAVTDVGSRRIRLCPGFGALPPGTAALILIHEALHDAGLRERPPDPGALTSAEINRLVKANCGR